MARTTLPPRRPRGSERGLLLHELAPRSASLEEAYMSLTQDAVEYRSEPTTTAAQKVQDR